MKKILIVFGTRPEAIKMAPVIIELKKHPEKFDVTTCITGQHKEMLQPILDWFSIQPDYNLDIMKNNQDLFDITTSVLTKIKEIIKTTKPNLLLIQGDTTTVMTASMAAFYENIDVGHIEAGLRTNDLANPFPEEFNRKVTSIIAKYNFAPTQSAKNNLLKENYAESSIHITGNTVIDALMYSKDKLLNYNYDNQYDINFHKKTILITAHRRESFGQEFVNICKSIKKLSQKYSEFEFVYPVHLNPKVQEPVKRILRGIKNIKLIKPLSYPDFIYLMTNSFIIMTDSGGVQEEAPSLGIPVLVLRKTTERPEAIGAGTVKLIGTNQESIINEVSNLIDNHDLYKNMCKKINPYGDGKASIKISNILAS
jgi:UDP-N-acetylglucosamine 2-epimerase (non-hydrolysing)